MGGAALYQLSWVPGGEDTPDFKWQGWSNRAKNQNQKNPKGFKQTPQKSLDQNLTPEKFHAEFPSPVFLF